MRHSKQIAVIITILNIALVIVCAVVWLRMDRTGPEFKFLISELVYKQDTKDAELMEGITASDARDGDVTDRIVIEKIIKNEKESAVVVFYAVSDAAGNVVKTSRVFPASFAAEEAEPEAVPVQGDEQLSQGDAQVQSETDKENDSEETGAKDAQEDEAAKETNEEEEAAEEEEQESSSEQEDAEEEPADDGEAAAQDENTRNTENKVVGAAPVITLKASEVNTKSGVTPAWVDIIGSLTDDTDDYGTLFSSLNVSKYDINTPGDYKVSLTVTDSNKNTSKPVTVTIHVK